MLIDELTDLRRREDVYGQLCSFGLINSLHHAIKQDRQLFPDLILTLLATGHEDIGRVRQDPGITLVEPLIVGGAQSKKPREDPFAISGSGGAGSMA